jgi:hypothetical protein
MPPPADRQTSVRLPSALYERLVAAAGKGGVGEEIRDRLEASFSQDERTAELVELVTALAGIVEKDLGPWHKDPYAFQAFTAGLSILLSALKPKGEPTPHPGELTKPDDDPQVIGRTLARVTLMEVTERWGKRNAEWSPTRKADWRIKQ